jgi:hypothetical protein
MDVRFYMDVHIPMAITEQLRRRAVDVLTAQDDGAIEIPDFELLERAAKLDRVTVTFDLGFKGLAESWQRDRRRFAGLLFGHQRAGSIGDYVNCLYLIATASELEEWQNVIQPIPW